MYVRDSVWSFVELEKEEEDKSGRDESQKKDKQSA